MSSAYANEPFRRVQAPDVHTTKPPPSASRTQCYLQHNSCVWRREGPQQRRQSRCAEPSRSEGLRITH